MCCVFFDLGGYRLGFSAGRFAFAGAGAAGLFVARRVRAVGVQEDGVIDCFYCHGGTVVWNAGGSVMQAALRFPPRPKAEE